MIKRHCVLDKPFVENKATLNPYRSFGDWGASASQIGSVLFGVAGWLLVLAVVLSIGVIVHIAGSKRGGTSLIDEQFHAEFSPMRSVKDVPICYFPKDVTRRIVSDDSIRLWLGERRSHARAKYPATLRLNDALWNRDRTVDFTFWVERNAVRNDSPQGGLANLQRWASAGIDIHDSDVHVATFPDFRGYSGLDDSKPCSLIQSVLFNRGVERFLTLLFARFPGLLSLFNRAVHRTGQPIHIVDNPSYLPIVLLSALFQDANLKYGSERVEDGSNGYQHAGPYEGFIVKSGLLPTLKKFHLLLCLASVLGAFVCIFFLVFSVYFPETESFSHFTLTISGWLLSSVACVLAFYWSLLLS